MWSRSVKLREISCGGRPSLLGGCTEAAGAKAAVQSCGGAGGEDGVIAFDERYGQRLHDGVDHLPDAAEVIDRFH